VRLVRDGEVVDPATWTRRARTGAVTMDDVVDAPRLLEHYATGATVVLQSMQRWFAPVTRFCRELEVVLTHPVQANAYLSPAGAAGLAAHHDTHDVFVLQLHGTKHWVVREPVMEAPLPRHRSDHARAGGRPVLFEATLRPGSCLYLPRGVVHAARAQEGSSLHLTVGILATTAYDVVRHVAAMAGDVPALRRSLPAGWARDRTVAEAVVKDVLVELAQFVEHVDSAAVVEHLSTRHQHARQPLLHGQLLELDALAAVADDTVVRRRDGVVLTRRVDGELLRLRAGDRTLELPAILTPAVDRLLDGEACRVGELADLLDEASRLVLVRRLVRDGLLRTGRDTGG
jgi:lysine-specific demethylase/histidyl-hydroxylase NO66